MGRQLFPDVGWITSGWWELSFFVDAEARENRRRVCHVPVKISADYEVALREGDLLHGHAVTFRELVMTLQEFLEEKKAALVAEKLADEVG
jgi:hypothetical protein